MTEKQIEKLNPTFVFDGMIMVEYFIISRGHSYYCIRSGLRNANDKIKSPFFYENCVGGKNAKEKALALFDKWWQTVKYL